MCVGGVGEFKREEGCRVGVGKIVEKKWRGEGRVDCERGKINKLFRKRGRRGSVRK